MNELDARQVGRGTGGIQEMPEKKGSRIGGIWSRIYAGHDGYMTGGMQGWRYAGKEESRIGGMLYWRDA